MNKTTIMTVIAVVIVIAGIGVYSSANSARNQIKELTAGNATIAANLEKFDTLVTGVFEGTFTKPMPIGNGQFIQPTGKAFKMPMATIGIWGPDGTMIEEHLFWDNQTYMNQIGLGQ